MMENKLGFGCMRLPVQDAADSTKVDFAQTCALFDRFLAAGGTYFDTAWIYHGGKSEEILGETLVARHPRDSFLLVDKMPMLALKAEGDQERIFVEQLRRCRVDFFDSYLLHNLNEEHYAIAKKFGTFDFLRAQKAAGRIRRLGFSFHDSAALLETILSENPDVEFVQLQINYLDWNDKNIQSGKCWEVCRRHGKPVVIMEPVKGGTLARLPIEAAELLENSRPGATAASWALRFAAGLDGVERVLSGMSDMAQLEDNLATFGALAPLSEGERALLDKVTAILSRDIAVPCTGCAYCTGVCPAKLPIPQYFDLYNRQKQFGGVSHAELYYENHLLRSPAAKDCLGCRKCERVCPQHIAVADRMKEVSAMFDKSKAES